MNRITITEATLSDFESLIEKVVAREFKKHLKNTCQANSSELMSVGQAADFLHLSPRTVQAKVRKRKLPFLKDEHRLYFQKSELLNHLKEQTNKEYGELNPADFLIQKKARR